MRGLGSGGFPKRPWMALLTSEFVGTKSSIMWADFKDTHALYYPKSGRFVGCNYEGVMLLGKTDLIMVNGVWVLEEDPELIGRLRDIPATDLTLSVIK